MSRIQVRFPSASATGKRRTLRVAIPRGIRPGQKIRLSNQGGTAGPTGAKGDLYLTVEILPHPKFRLEGADLHTQIPVAPWKPHSAARSRSRPSTAK